MLFSLISIRCFYCWTSQAQILLSAQLIIHLDCETGTNLRKFAQEQFLLLELKPTFVAFYMFSVKGIVQKIILPLCANVLQDLPRYFLLHQLLDLALPTITPSSYTWEVAANSEFISAHEQLKLFPPMHYSVFIFTEFHLPNHPVLLNPSGHPPSPPYFLAWFHHLIIQLIF